VGRIRKRQLRRAIGIKARWMISISLIQLILHLQLVLVEKRKENPVIPRESIRILLVFPVARRIKMRKT